MPQPALNVNMDAHTNVESLSFSLDGLAKKIAVITVIDPITQQDPDPDPDARTSACFKPPLGSRPTPPAQDRVRATTSRKLTPTEAAAQASSAYLHDNADAISGIGSLDVLRYGRVLRSRMLVGVRGAGLAYDGLYYVNSVTHNIKRGEYKQSFTLSRDGLISNTPRVPGMSEAASDSYYGKYRGTVINNIDPDAARPAPGDRARRARARCRRPGRGRACRSPADRSADGRLHGAADRRRRLGRVRAGRSRLSDLGRLLLGLAGRGADARPRRAAGRPEHRAADDAARTCS